MAATTQAPAILEVSAETREVLLRAQLTELASTLEGTIAHAQTLRDDLANEIAAGDLGGWIKRTREDFAAVEALLEQAV